MEREARSRAGKILAPRNDDRLRRQRRRLVDPYRAVGDAPRPDLLRVSRQVRKNGAFPDLGPRVLRGSLSEFPPGNAARPVADSRSSGDDLALSTFAHAAKSRLGFALLPYSV